METAWTTVKYIKDINLIDYLISLKISQLH